MWRALLDAAIAGNAHDLAGQLWHPVLFYTTGKVVQAALAEREKMAYDTYMHRGGVFTRFHGALAEHWQPYLDGQLTLREAATRLVAAVKPTQRGSDDRSCALSDYLFPPPLDSTSPAGPIRATIRRRSTAA